MLFKIDDSPSFVLGSFHFLPHGAKMPASWAEAYRRTKQLIVEVRFDEAPTVISEYEDGSTLRDHIPADLLPPLTDACSRLNLSIEYLQSQHPWSVGISLGRALHLRSGRKPPGIDHIFFRRAKGAGKPIGALESPNDGMGSFGKIDKLQTIDSLRYFVNDEDVRLRLATDLYNAWVAESPDRMLTAMPEMDLFPDFKQKILLDRNSAWLPTLVEEIQSQKPTLFVVGAMHLIGTGSLREILDTGSITLTHIPR